MAVKIKFDNVHNVISPTFILSKRNGEKIGVIPAQHIAFSDVMNGCAETSFSVYKTLNDKRYKEWNLIKDFKLMYCRDWDLWFEIYVQTEESNETVKHVQARTLGEAELSQVNLYNIQINTDDDIARDDYKVATIFNEEDKEASILHRITEKIPHYTFKYIDPNIAKIQRTFTFDNISIYDAFQEIAQEVDCIFIIGSHSNAKGLPERTISVYDLQSRCMECGHREDFSDVCPKCGSHNIDMGYGEDTSIFISSENLADSIIYSTDVDSVKNCFKLEAGDDLMTATVINCNPNGSGYIWNINPESKEDMPEELVSKIAEYDKDYDYYYNDYIANIPTTVLTLYNNLVDKYRVYSTDYERIPDKIKGYPALMQAYYDTIDFYLYLKDVLMPPVDTAKTSAVVQAAKLTSYALSPVAVQNLKTASKSTVDSATLAMAKVIVDPRFKVSINDSSYSGDHRWTGNFKIENYSDEEDVATSSYSTIAVTDEYVDYVKQKMDKALNKKAENFYDIVDIFKMGIGDFVAHIRKYALVPLTELHDACQTCIDIMIEQGVATKESWNGEGENGLYEQLYFPYYRKLLALENEIRVREAELEVISGSYNSLGDIRSKGLQMYIKEIRDKVQKILDFELYLGEELWKTFLSYRREDTYSNSNYISDGLNNAEIFQKALEFVEIAKKEIFKSSVLQHSISASLNNLLVMKEFAPILDSFRIGNWLRIKVDDKLYRLRLIAYDIDFDNLEDISITFSDVKSVINGVSDAESILDQVTSISGSYNAVAHQASQGKKSKEKLDNWVNDGLALTKMKIVDSADNQNITWDSHGLLCTEYLPITDTYSDKQLKIINRGLYLTDDNWQTAKTGIGDFTFYNPDSKQYEEAYGVIADVLVGNLILSKKVGIYNTDNSITLDDHGLTITTNAEGKPKAMMTLQRLLDDGNGNEYYDKIMYIADDGNLVLNGSVHINSATSSDTFTIDEWRTSFDLDMEGIHEEVSKVETNVDGTLKEFKTSVDTTINDISSTVSKKVGKDEIISQINQSAEAVKIKAGKISLEGTVTMNGNVKITEDGRMIAKNGEFSGTVKTKGADNSGNSLVTAVLHGSDYASTDQFTAGITFYNIYGKRIGFYRGYADGNDDNMRALNSYVFKSDGISVSSGISLQGGGLAYLIDSHGTGNILSTSNTLIESGTAFIEERYMEEIDETYTAYIDDVATKVVRKVYSCTMPITGNKAFTKNAVAVVTANTTAPHLVWATCSKVDSNGNFTIYLHRRDGRYSTSISWMLIESKV